MNFLETLFYLSSGFMFVIEMSVAMDPEKYYNLSHLVNEPGESMALSTEKGSIIIEQLVYFTWTFIGLFTFQWPLFLAIILLGLVPKCSLPRNLAIPWIRIDSFLCSLMILFIVLNKYHFQWMVGDDLVKSLF